MIVTFSSPEYRRWLDMLLQSAHITNPHIPIRAYLMGWEDKDIEEYKKKYPHCEFRRHGKIQDNYNYEFKEDHILSTTLFKMTIILNEVSNQPIFFIDADTLILKNIDQLFDKLNEYDFATTVRKTLRTKIRIYAGVMGFACNQNAIKFITQSLIFRCNGDDKLLKDWGEQYAFAKTMKGSGLNMCRLKDEEHSISMNEEAMILSAKMGKNTKDEKYIWLKSVFTKKFGKDPE